MCGCFADAGRRSVRASAAAAKEKLAEVVALEKRNSWSKNVGKGADDWVDIEDGDDDYCENDTKVASDTADSSDDIDAESEGDSSGYDGPDGRRGKRRKRSGSSSAPKKSKPSTVSELCEVGLPVNLKQVAATTAAELEKGPLTHHFDFVPEVPIICELQLPLAGFDMLRVELMSDSAALKDGMLEVAPLEALAPIERGLLVANVGGPIELLEWAPHTANSAVGECVAVVADLPPAVRKSVTGNQTGGVLQLWQGQLGEAGGASMQLASVIVLEESPSAMAWCPRAWNKDRVGVLAVAVGHRVLIFSVSVSLLELRAAPCAARCQPILNLVDGISRVSAVAWSNDAACNWLAAGRCDGRVSIFSLAGHDCGSVVIPEAVLAALEGSVCCVAFCPTDAGLLAVSGYDDTIQLWNVAEQQCLDRFLTEPMPHLRCKREFAWPRNHLGFFYAAEELVLRFFEPGEKLHASRVSVARGDIITCDCSDFFQLAAAGCEDGAVTCAFFPSQDKPPLQGVIQTRKIFHAARVNAVIPGSADAAPMLQLWVDNFPDYKTLSLKKSQRTLRDQIRPSLPDGKIWNSRQNITRVRFGPSHESCSWLSFGTNSGLLTFIHIQEAASECLGVLS